MKKSWLITVIAIVCCILMSGVWGISSANNLVEMLNLTKKYEADIQTELQTRFEKVPNLVEIVKGAAKHEETIIKTIAEAREKYNKAVISGDTAAMLEADTAVNTAITAFAEQYPDIASMDLYKGLMDEYSGIESAVAVARRNYNEVVMQYNNKIEMFPTSIIAQIKGFERIEEFKASEAANDPIKIDMSK